MGQRLSEYDRDQLLNLLTERLSFERSAVRLYDKIIDAIERSGSAEYMHLFDQMRGHRMQEKEHEEWLKTQVQAIGGNAEGETELSDLVRRETEGVDRVIMSDPELPHLFHALLAAELVDDAGWDLLAALADEAGDQQMKAEFERRWHEEEQHLAHVQGVIEQVWTHKLMGGALEIQALD